MEHETTPLIAAVLAQVDRLGSDKTIAVVGFDADEAEDFRRDLLHTAMKREQGRRVAETGNCRIQWHHGPTALFLSSCALWPRIPEGSALVLLPMAAKQFYRVRRIYDGRLGEVIEEREAVAG